MSSMDIDIRLSSVSPRRRKRFAASCENTLGCSRSPPECARVGYTMTPAQMEMIERLEDLVDYIFIEVRRSVFDDSWQNR